jgi:ATP-dependent RNA helicase RhlE
VTFEELNLNATLLKALSELEYVYPTPIQEKAFPIIMSGRNVVGIAQTGTGKTFAYLLPMLRQLSFSDQKDPRILILAPTRELVIQILNEIKKLTAYTQIRSGGIYGGTNINTQKQLIYSGIDILVATPGRLIDLAFTGVLRLKSIQKLVIDEVDEMLSLGFRAQLTSLLGLLPQKRQTLMFSATLTQDVETFIIDAIPIPLKIEIAPHGTPIEKIIQKAYHIPNFNTKVNLLKLLLSKDDEYSKVLIFVDSKKLADRLFDQMDKIFPNLFGVIHSNKSHNNRLNALKLFQEGSHKYLIATDIIARGMDITDVSHVINFDMPEVPGDYIHRIGRTGRAEKAGIAISFVNKIEQEYQDEIEKLMRKKIPNELLPENLIISKIFNDDEKPANLFDKNYHKEPSIKGSKGAFHEKKDKNKKVNLGGPGKRNPKFSKSGKLNKQRNTGKTRF